jgi:hypothetical protein
MLILLGVLDSVSNWFSKLNIVLNYVSTRHRCLHDELITAKSPRPFAFFSDLRWQLGFVRSPAGLRDFPALVDAFGKCVHSNVATWRIMSKHAAIQCCYLANDFML